MPNELSEKLSTPENVNVFREILLKKIMERWGVSKEEIAKITGYDLTEYQGFLCGKYKLPTDREKRAGILIGIDVYLEGLFRDTNETKRWLRTEIPALKYMKPGLQTYKPLELLTEGSYENLELIHECVLRMCGL